MAAPFDEHIVFLRRYPRDGGVRLRHCAEAVVDSLDSAADEARLFAVALPNGGTIEPVDWRRFAYHHEDVNRLIARCLEDNLADLEFSPASPELSQAIGRRLTMAMRDLATMFDVTEVRCEFRDGLVCVFVAGQFKNGERSNIALNR